MSEFAFWTGVAIWLLVVGTPVVFVWFLKDAARLLRGLGEGRDDRAGDDSGENGA